MLAEFRRDFSEKYKYDLQKNSINGNANAENGCLRHHRHNAKFELLTETQTLRVNRPILTLLYLSIYFDFYLFL